MKSKCVRNAFYQLVKDYGKVLFVIGGFLLCLSSYAQIGINTSDPNATLEIIAQKRPQIPDGLLVPRLTATETQSMTALSSKQNSLLIYVTNNLTTASRTQECINIDSEGYYFYHHLSGQAKGVWKKLGSGGGGGNYTAGAGIEIASGVISATGLESVPVGASNGWRLIGEDNSKHANLGTKAVDLSVTSVLSDVGAKGDYSFAVGLGSRAFGNRSIAMGHNNTIKGLSSIGIGYLNQTKGDNAFGIGQGNTNIGNNAYALGNTNQPEADHSYTIGRGNKVTTNNSMSIGFYNRPNVNNIFSIGTGISDSNTDRRNALVISKATKNESKKDSRNFVAIGKEMPNINSDAIFQVNGLIQSEDINKDKYTMGDPSRVVVADNNGVLKTTRTSYIGAYLPSYKGGELLYKPFAGLYGEYFHGEYIGHGYKCWKYIGYAKLISFADMVVSEKLVKEPQFYTITAPERLAPFVGGEYYVKNIPLNIIINPAYNNKGGNQIKHINYSGGYPLYREHGRVIYPFNRKGESENFDYQGSSFILAIMRYTISSYVHDFKSRKVTIEFLPYTPEKYDSIKNNQPSNANNTDDFGTFYYPVLLQPKLVVIPTKPVDWKYKE